MTSLLTFGTLLPSILLGSHNSMAKRQLYEPFFTPYYYYRSVTMLVSPPYIHYAEIEVPAPGDPVSDLHSVKPQNSTRAGQ